MITFKYGLPNKDDFFEKKYANWESVKSNKNSLIIGVFIGVVLAIFTSEIISAINLIPMYNFRFYKNILLFIIVLIIHEFLHIMVFPNPLNATIGIYLPKMIFYATTNDEFSRNRLLLSYMFPLLVLTIIPLIFLPFYNNKILANIAILNLIGSGVDIVHFLIIKKMPSNTKLVFSGGNLYANKD